MLGFWTAALSAYAASQESDGGGGGGPAAPPAQAGDRVNEGIKFGVSDNDHQSVIKTGIVMAGVVLVAIAVRMSGRKG